MVTDGFPACSTAILSQPLPPGAAGSWCRVSLRVRCGAAWWAQLELTDEARGQVVRDCFLGRLRSRGAWQMRATLVHVPRDAADVVVRIYGGNPEGAALRVVRLSRGGATLRLLWHGRRLVARCLAGDADGRLGRLRAVMGQAPARGGDAPPYAAWIALCETKLPAPPASPALDWLIAVTGADRTALNASLASLAAQTVSAPAACLITTPDDWGALAGRWAVLVQAGEVLAPDALAWFAHIAATRPEARFITADCDWLTAAGARVHPLFKPGPDSVLLRSCLLSLGVCAVRMDAVPADLPPAADAARRVLALASEGAVIRVPRILTHIAESAAAAPVSPPRLERPKAFAPRVTAIVPSAVRSAHVPRCLARIATHTDYPAFCVDLVLSDPKNADPLLLRRIAELPFLHIRQADLRSFNYAAANNQAAAQADGELLLLLNDDVAPLRADWLSAMVAYMQDPRVGMVGARLLYGNGMVQHEGVVMGLAHLCEHAGRLRAGDDPGPHGLAMLDREVSAVTAACMLIRADLYRALGGMDESFAIALNDVDLCLRARRAGWKIVYCAGATLWHYESLSLGRHYAGSRAALEVQEVRRLRALWPDAIQSDPFYNPSASLEPGREWQPAFPPRMPGVTAWPANPAATG